jgi:hypothetical protein
LIDEGEEFEAIMAEAEALNQKIEQTKCAAAHAAGVSKGLTQAKGVLQKVSQENESAPQAHALPTPVCAAPYSSWKEFEASVNNGEFYSKLYGCGEYGWVHRDAVPQSYYPSLPLSGCTAFLNEPNTQLRHGIDYPGALPGSSLGENPAAVLPVEWADEEYNCFPVQDWQDIDLEFALDSGCCAHIMDTKMDAPGYELQESEGSRQGKTFVVGNGEQIANEGQVALNLEAPNGRGGSQALRSVFQSAKVTRPLMSVSQICDNGYTCIFEKDKATVVDKDQQPKFVCERRGGLYLSPMRLKAPPPPFGRQAP